MGEMVAYKIEMGFREAIIAVLFMVFVMGLIGAAQAGVFNPIMVGAILTVTVILVFIGYGLVKMDVITRSALPVWYVFVLGLVLLFYGAIARGVIPLAVYSEAMTLQEAILFTALIYVLVVVAVFAIVGALYVLAKKGMVWRKAY
jgi:hypothetical protein